ncbi:hypothetical protein HNP84_009150 [Thermocatellispora tengchongensis]|uniref:Secreted protein n=1 Tax=Thermocatellispora tengchongensis TaxID=1073253 RepID=A0A840PQM7_9ACTN|nr:hypothetical protein [Thermocatellispora tengchongensis]MBB5139387.1 hypothetical protein [Thermocatellispora tengchongensis]
MLKKLVLGGAALAAFAGLGLTTPAQADAPWPGGGDVNVSEQSGNTIVCGNQAIGDILILLVPLTPVTQADRDGVDCGVRVIQN